MRFVLPIIIVVLMITSGVFLISRNLNTRQESGQNLITQTPQTNDTPKDCTGKPVVELTEGPYYKTGSTERQKIAEPNTAGQHLILKGYVFDAKCNPVANVWLDFWQADGEGNYDNEGYNLRGHQYTDENGFFILETVIPGQYPGRTEHIHFKVRKSQDSPILTSQLFFPDSQTNETDSIFDESLVVDLVSNSDGSKFATYNILVP